MRELVKLFGTPETIDNLGLGQLRDTISNSLFPGTSVAHVGARYMLLVPWAYLSSHHGTSNPGQLRKRAEESERQLIDRLHELGEDGYIGSDAGRNVRQLPSAAYWSALRRYGIVNPETDRAMVAQVMCEDLSTPEDGDNAHFVWHPSLPKPPADFPQSEENGLKLTNDEARWLQERILSSCPGTMLSHIVGSPESPISTSWAPWVDPICRQAQGATAQWLRDAESFSFIHNGAGMLYHRLLAEHSHEAFGGGESNLERTQAILDVWEDERASKRQMLAEWDVDGFIGRAREITHSINSNTADFARVIASAAAAPGKLTDNAELRTALVTREKLMKKTNSRFRNARRLRAWQAPDRVGALSFRWPQVKRSVLDIHAGLNQEAPTNA